MKKNAKFWHKWSLFTFGTFLQVHIPTDLDGIDIMCEKVDRQEFVDVLKAMLCMDQDKRLTPNGGLQHKFVKMSHLSEMGRTK